MIPNRDCAELRKGITPGDEFGVFQPPPPGIGIEHQFRAVAQIDRNTERLAEAGIDDAFRTKRFRTFIESNHVAFKGGANKGP